MQDRTSIFHPIFLSTFVVSLLGAAVSARAEIVLQSQHRQLVTLASVVAGGESGSDGDVFNEEGVGAAGFQDSADQAIGQTVAMGQGEHISNIGTDGFTITGYTHATAAVEPAVPEVFAEGLGSTSVTVRFDVSTATEYWLTGSLMDNGAGQVTVTLFEQDSGVVLDVSPEQGEALNVDEQGVLPAGSYIYVFVSGGYAQAGFEGAVPVAHGDFDVSLWFLSAVSVPEVAGRPGGVTVSPNPLSAGQSLRIRMVPALEGTVVTIADVAGRLVRRMTVPAGNEAISWDATDARGVSAPPGVYFVRALGSRDTKRLVVLR